MPHFLARYTLERVIGRRRQNGAVQYLCRWREARPEEDSWESAILLLGSDLVDEFNARYIDALDAAHDYEFVPQDRVPLAERIRTPSPAPPPYPQSPRYSPVANPMDLEEDGGYPQLPWSPAYSPRNEPMADDDEDDYADMPALEEVEYVPPEAPPVPLIERIGSPPLADLGLVGSGGSARSRDYLWIVDRFTRMGNLVEANQASVFADRYYITGPLYTHSGNTRSTRTTLQMTAFLLPLRFGRHVLQPPTEARSLQIVHFVAHLDEDEGGAVFEFADDVLIIRVSSPRPAGPA